jgi:lysozyme family protein
MASFFIAVAITLDDAHEGGFQKNPHDRANWTGGQVGVGTLVGTKYGITTLDMPGVDIANLTTDQASTYYSAHYWKQGYSQIADQLVANKLFDMGVLFGVGTAVKVLQTVLGVTPDGGFGPTTLSALNAAGDVLASFKSAMINHATSVAAANQNDAPFLSDWLRRISS